MPTHRFLSKLREHILDVRRIKGHFMANRVDQPISRVHQNCPEREYAVILESKICTKYDKIATIGSMFAGAQEKTRSTESDDRRALSVMFDAIFAATSKYATAGGILEAPPSAPSVPPCT